MCRCQAAASRRNALVTAAGEMRRDGRFPQSAIFRGEPRAPGADSSPQLPHRGVPSRLSAVTYKPPDPVRHPDGDTLLTTGSPEVPGEIDRIPSQGVA